jgi:hypothetical protein
MYLIGFPLLVIPFAIYNMIAFLTPGVSWSDAIVTFTLISGAAWPVTASDALLGLAIVLMPLELYKASTPGARSVVDHILSMALFVVMLIEFVLVRQAGTSTFFVLMAIALLDAVGGFIVARRAAHRDLAIDQVDAMAG